MLGVLGGSGLGVLGGSARGGGLSCVSTGGQSLMGSQRQQAWLTSPASSAPTVPVMIL